VQSSDKILMKKNIGKTKEEQKKIVNYFYFPQQI